MGRRPATRFNNQEEANEAQPRFNFEKPGGWRAHPSRHFTQENHMTDITFGAFDLQADGGGPVAIRLVAAHKKLIPVTLTTRRAPKRGKMKIEVMIYVSREAAWMIYHELGLKLRSEKP
jgi:hypothetical protein